MKKLFAACAAVVVVACAHQAVPPLLPPPPPPPPPVLQPPVDPIVALIKARRDLVKRAIANPDVDILNQAIAADPMIAPFLQLRLIDVYTGRSDFANAAAVAAQIVATAGDTTAATIARIRLPALYARAGDMTSAEGALQQAITLPLDELTEAEFVSAAKSLDAASRSDLAAKIRMRLLTEFPQGRFTEDTYDRLNLDALPFDDALSIAQKLAQHDRYDRALDLLNKIAARFPNATQGDAYRNVRFRALFNSRHYTELLSESAGPKPDPALALMRARAAWRIGKNDQFLNGLKAIERNAPDSPQAVEAKILRAKYYTSDETNYDVAVENLKAAIDAGAIGNEGENLWQLAFVYILAKRNDDALRAMGDYLARFSDGDYTSNALFWSGKLGDRAQWQQLIAKYPYSYFSYRAKELGAPSPSSQLNALIFPPLDLTRPQTVDELAAVGLMRDASREMKRIAAASPDNLSLQFQLADLYVQGGEPFKANGILQRRFREFVRHGGVNIPQRFWEILFPLNYWPSIQREAARQNIDPYLVASIIRQESGFEPSTVSNAGAVGLMQIMPAEAQSIASRGGIDETITRERLFDPEVNIAIGAAELAQKLHDMQGNPILGIAAYNAGPDAVGKWIAQTPIDDIDLFVEAIPYAETRLYVKTVTRNRFEYRRIYERSSSSTETQSK